MEELQYQQLFCHQANCPDQEDTGILLEQMCSCESYFPMLKITRGRKSDVFKTYNGTVIPTTFLCQSIATIEGIKQFQVVQERVDSYLVRIVKENSFTESTAENVKAKLKKIVGEAEISVLIEGEIPREESGKRKAELDDKFKKIHGTKRTE